MTDGIRTVLMIEPVAFGANPETALTNKFQESDAGVDLAEVQRAARSEFHGVVNRLREAGVEVLVERDTEVPHTPDAVFPNNWFSTHADGTLALYPMQSAIRAREVREDWGEVLGRAGFAVSRTLDLREGAGGLALEGTGSLVLDRSRRVAFVARSERSAFELAQRWADELGYRLVYFDAADRNGDAIYHTNVLLAVGATAAVVCAEAVRDAGQRERLLEELGVDGRSLVELSFDQLESFAGNLLELVAADGTVVWAMSQSARDCLTEQQVAALTKTGARLVSAPIGTIERYGGGSVRCMLAEIDLPRSVRTAPPS